MGGLGKLIIAKGFKNMPKVQKIAQSGHSSFNPNLILYLVLYWMYFYIFRNQDQILLRSFSAYLCYAGFKHSDWLKILIIQSK